MVFCAYLTTRHQSPFSGSGGTAMNIDHIDTIDRLSNNVDGIMSALIAVYGNGDNHDYLSDHTLCSLFHQISFNMAEIRETAYQIMKESKEAKR